jgi:hypothetical protein
VSYRQLTNPGLEVVHRRAAAWMSQGSRFRASGLQ